MKYCHCWLSLIVAGCCLGAQNWQTSAGIRIAPGINDCRVQTNPQIAFDGDSIFLVVWQLGENIASWEKGDIVATRLDRKGNLIDDSPIPICTLSASHQECPSVAYNGTRFLVAWNDLRNGRDWDIYGCRILADGTVLDPGGFAVAQGAGSQLFPRVAEDSAGFITAYQEKNSAGFFHVCLRRIGDDGSITVLPTPVMASGDTTWNGIADIAKGTGDTWLLSWLDQSVYSMNSPLRTGQLFEQDGAWKIQNIKTGTTGVMGSNDRAVVFAPGPHSSFLCYGNYANLFENGDAAILPNPNPEKNTLCLFGCAPVMQEGKVSAAFGQGNFIAVGLMEAVANMLYISSRINAQGLRLEGDVKAPLYAASGTLSRPVIAGTDSGFVAVFRETADTLNQLKAFYFRYGADTTVAENTEKSALIPLFEIRPNPSDGISRITVQDHDIEALQIFDVQGRRIADLLPALERRNSGTRVEISWESPMASGKYWAVLKTRRGSTIKAITLIKQF